MRTLFIPARALQDVSLTKQQIAVLPKPVGLLATAQYEHTLKNLHSQVKDSLLLGTVLGCNIFRSEKAGVNSYLLVGTGKFHALAIAVMTKKPVFVFNPYDSRVSQVSHLEVAGLLKKKKLDYIRFLQAETVGILVSTKPGQQNLKRALEIQKDIRKESYVFLADSLDLDSLQNFPFVDCWVNTACPRLSEDSSIPLINAEDLLHLNPA
jgi:2-(3-amino-3-carboxypropyl)histidine synthase